MVIAKGRHSKPSHRTSNSTGWRQKSLFRLSKKWTWPLGDLIRTLVKSFVIERDLRICIENMHKCMVVEKNENYTFEEVD
jgi:hypothetical protein